MMKFSISTRQRSKRAVMSQHVLHLVLLCVPQHCCHTLLATAKRIALRLGKFVVTMCFAWGIAMTCSLCLHVDPCTRSPMTKNTTVGIQSLAHVVTTTLASTRNFSLKKKWDRLRCHVVSCWIFLCYRGAQQAGSSETTAFWPCDLPLLRFLCAPGAFALFLGMTKSGCCQAYLPWLLGDGANP